MPSEEWVERVYHHKWYAGETISVAIGQGAVTVTPIQLARMVAAVASGGTLVQPHFFKNLPDLKADHFPLSEDAVEQVTQGMYGVVNEGGGTGYHLRLQNIDFCGKSGTAQLMSYDAANRIGNKKMDGWFVGFAPRRNPEIVVAAIVQNTMEHGGEAAGPVVRDIVKAYYDKKNAGTQQQPPAELRRLPLRFGLWSQPSAEPAVKALAHERSSAHSDFDWALLAIVAAISTIGVLEIYSSTHASAHGRHAVEAAHLDRRRRRGNVPDLAHRLPHSDGPGSRSLHVRPRHSTGRSGDRPFPLRRQALGRAGWRRQFASVRTNEVDYNHSAGALLCGSAHGPADAADLVKVAVLTGVPVGLILIQPDLGTAMVLVPVAVVGAFLAGIEWKHMAVGLVLVALMIPVGWNMRHHLKPYQQQRIETFLHPEENPRGAGYQILQSEIAVGSGGFWGKGFGKGSQNQLGFVPVRYSDFILAALAEEQGFIGVCVVLLLYLGLILRLVDNAQKAKDRAGMYVVMGVTAILGFHVLVNASMVIGYMPVTGIPLPLMSYGGSSTAFVFLALGLVMNVRMRRFVN